ncbi:hypothetical protein K438DRAFT_542113 [Mycena galopus ATCC 62051]|nr:hypothetical protein K438DRAFT_542113 [Mycena galopus ATCC 62051]
MGTFALVSFLYFFGPVSLSRPPLQARPSFFLASCPCLVPVLVCARRDAYVERRLRRAERGGARLRTEGSPHITRTRDAAPHGGKGARSVTRVGCLPRVKQRGVGRAPDGRGRDGARPFESRSMLLHPPRLSDVYSHEPLSVWAPFVLLENYMHETSICEVSKITTAKISRVQASRTIHPVQHSQLINFGFLRINILLKCWQSMASAVCFPTQCV